MTKQTLPTAAQVAGVIFWALTGAEEIDSIIDPIAIEVARQRGWRWGQGLGPEPGTLNGTAKQENESFTVGAEPGGPPPVHASELDQSSGRESNPTAL